MAVWVDPPADPARGALVAYSLLLAYLVYSVILALVLSSVAAPFPRVGFGAHLLDLAVAITVNALTGVGSPFFVLFVFLLVAAALRWQWRGILLTGTAILTAYALLAIFGFEQRRPSFELDRFIIRGAYLAVVAVLLGFLGTWEGQLRRGLVELADFPRRRHRTFEDAVRDSLANAAAILRAPRVMIAWEDTEEPWLDTMLWSDGKVTRERHDPGTLLPLVAEPLRDAAFLCLDLKIEQPTVIRTAESGLLAWRGQPLHPELARRVNAGNVLSVPVIGEGVNARLFAFDKPQFVSDDLVVGLILGRQIVAVLEQHFLMVETQALGRQPRAHPRRSRAPRRHRAVARRRHLPRPRPAPVGGLRSRRRSGPASTRSSSCWSTSSASCGCSCRSCGPGRDHRRGQLARPDGRALPPGVGPVGGRSRARGDRRDRPARWRGRSTGWRRKV